MLTTHHKILIVEDNHSDADLVVRELKKNGLGFTSKLVETRQAFEAAIEDFEPNIILSDYSLPLFDGLSAFHFAQRKCPDIPFIMISGTIGEETAVEMIKSGVTDYVLKDKLFTLIPKIERALKEAKEHKEKRIIDEELKVQNAKLREIALMQSHVVRVPIAHIMGLFSLFKFDNPQDPVNAEILSMLKAAADSFDIIIHEIVKKTEEIGMHS
ncbi:response regulator [uncultured Mucilaginibacter sp.]|uniref:response regulator n=1 Tax=uncultured Mucilaginibacter sp. TaxID=797541 RepID=UPI0025F2FD34|nr:response regulator [uncultured Mucilaginibacter sp.]